MRHHRGTLHYSDHGGSLSLQTWEDESNTFRGIDGVKRMDRVAEDH